MILAVDEATADANVNRLQELWAADAFIADAETGRTWQGWNSILDRYNSDHDKFIPHPPSQAG